MAFDRPTCDSCWFSKREMELEHKRTNCLRDPVVVMKNDDDFCHSHPAWSEYETLAKPDAISDFYARQSP